MGWLTRTTVERKDSGSLLRMLGGEAPDPEWPASNFLSHVEHGWNKNELVYACIEELATSLPEGTLRVYDALGRRGEPVQGHPLRRLMSTPNPYISEYELFELLVVHLMLAGNAFWEKVRDRAGRVVELWPLRPDRVRMIRKGRTVRYGYVVGEQYIYGRMDNSYTVPVEVVHFKLPNPVDPLVGTPPMRAALRATALDNSATDFVKALLGNSAIPGVVVTMGNLDTVLDEQITRRLTEKWKARFGGRKRGEPAFLQTGMDVKQLGLNLKDLEFPDLRTISESRICMSFGVPPIIIGAKVGLDRSTFANYQEARKAFWEQTLMPLQRRVRDTIAAQLLTDMAGGGPGSRGLRNLSLRWDNSEVVALRESEADRWNRATEAFRAGGLTVNDYRREIGQPEVSGGDVFLVPSGVIATRDMAGAVESLNGQQRPQEPAPAKSALQVETKSATLRTAAEAEHRRTLTEYFEARRADVLATVGGKAALVNRDAWDKDLTERLYKVGLAAATVAGTAAWSDYDQARTENYQYARAQGIAGDVNDALASDAESAIVAADPKSAIRDLFTSYLDATVAMYAVSLTTAALGWGATEAGRQAVGAGKTATKTWNTGRNPRESHADLDGESVSVDQPFSNGMNFPGDSRIPAETANCNCTVTVTVK